MTPWTVACHDPLSKGFPRQEYWIGLPFLSSGESSQPRDWTHISCIGRHILNHWVAREAHLSIYEFLFQILFEKTTSIPVLTSHLQPIGEKEIMLLLSVSIIFFSLSAAAAAKSLQSCPVLCDHIDGSPPSSPVPGILQARTLEWVAISFSNAWKWKVKVKSLSRVWLLATPWTAAHQAPPSVGFSRQEYWSGVPLPSPSFPFLVSL